MSGPLAIATVTAVLKDLLNDGLVNSDLSISVGTVTVSALPPDRVATGAEEPSRLNLFLYQVTANPGWRNAELPSRDGDGGRVSSAPLALDLHYLLTAYGADDLDAEILLGYAMQLLHENPGLSRDMIRKTFSVTSPVTDKLLPPSAAGLNAADLADQVELCKVTPRYLTTEELSRLWSAMQARYRPSMAYDVSVVLIEATAPVRAALPVRTALLRAEPMARPVIDRLDPPTVTDGGAVTIKGRNLKGTTTTTTTKVRVGGILQKPAPEDVGDSQLTMTLPGGLRAGVNPVQVVHEIELGKPPTPHPGAGFESNVAAIVLAPLVTTAPPISVAAGATLTLAVAPAVAREQRVAVLIGERRIAVPPRAPTDPPSATTIDVDIPADLGAGTFLLRVQVDGAISPLEVDDNRTSPTYNRYVGPTIEVT
jgi:hypothetical protein